jgi:hypothetical protein
MKKRNSIITGLLNALIPGSGHLYVNNDWGRFIPVFIGYSILLFATYLLGNAIQNLRNSALPAGLLPGLLILAVLVLLFFSGMKISNIRNNETTEAAYYESRRTNSPQDNESTKLNKLSKQREEGLISNEQYDSKKADIESKK